MNLVVRIVLAVLVGLVVSGLLNYFGVLNPSLNGLLGVIAAIVVFFGYGDRRVL